MKAVVVFESLYGNTHRIADEIADGIAAAAPEAEVLRLPVGEAAGRALDGVGLLVVGGPTHMRGLTTHLTRTQALRAEATTSTGTLPEIEPHIADAGLRDWFGDLPPAPRGARGAAFDTRVEARFAGGAARGIESRLRHHGYVLLAEPCGFHVTDTAGPLKNGELDRARGWGTELGRAWLAVRAAEGSASHG